MGLITPEIAARAAYPESLSLCDVLEYRGDLFVGATGRDSLTQFYEAWVGALRKGPGKNIQVMHTLRLERDGGRWANEDASKRIGLWRSLAELRPSVRPDWVDIELETLEENESVVGTLLGFLQSQGIRVLVSHHQFQVPYGIPEYESLLRRMVRFKPDGVKFASTVHAEKDAIELMRFAAEVAHDWPVSGVFAMGKLGQATRVASPVVGCPLTYGTFDSTALAPGQIPLVRLARGVEMVYRQFETVEDWSLAKIDELWKAANLWLDKDGT